MAKQPGDWTRNSRRRWLAERLFRRFVRHARKVAKSDDGVAVAIRTGVLLATAAVVSNTVGAVVVFVVAGPVRPLPKDVADPDRQLILNLVATAIYLVIAVVVGSIWSAHRVKPVNAWLLAGRTPSSEEQRDALRFPLSLAQMYATLWLAAVPLFGVLNVLTSGSMRLGIGVALTVVLGGITTVAVGYLVAERMWREIAEAALRAGVPEKAPLPGVRSRLLITWLLASGVPLLGLLLIAVDPVGYPKTRLTLTVVVLSVIGLGVGLLAQVFAARSVSDPLTGVRQALAKIAEGELDVYVDVYDGGEIGLLQGGVNQMAEGLRERERLRDLFGRQVGADVAAEAIADSPRLGGESRDVAVLFVDIIGSTTIAEDRDPEEVVSLLNEFFECVVSVVADHGGLINKFEGDAALCVFGAPQPLEDAATACLCAARALATQLQNLSGGLEAGIGVSSGRAVAGWVGAESRYEYTVIGDPVNEAARLTDEAKQEDPRLLANAEVVEQASHDEQQHWSVSGETTLRGRSEPTRLAHPTDLRDADCPHAVQPAEGEPAESEADSPDGSETADSETSQDREKEPASTG